ncbi:MAG: transcriptional repressor [Endomicrobiales bacterium]|nr:transcriptional repressor [Endomicrobiales bacterium]
MPKEKSVLIGFLKKNKMKMTSQRDKILDFFLKWEKHLSPDEMYYELKKLYPRIGRATVYRTLKLLTKANIASQVELGDGASRFEHKYNHPHHYHLICSRCGKLIEFVSDKIDALKKNISKKHSFLPNNVRFEIFGLCKKCQKYRN